MKPQAASDVPRIMLMVLILGLLIAGSFWILTPFLGALIWAAAIVDATWPLLESMQRRVGGSRSLAVTIMIGLVLLAFIVPLSLAVGTLIKAADRSPHVIRDFLAQGLGPAPAWLAKVPAVGTDLSSRWQAISDGGPDALLAALKPYTHAVAAWVLSATGGIGMTIVQIVLVVVVTGILYAKGEVAAGGAIAFARRLAGDRGEYTVRLAGQAVRSVALGVVLTALVQSILAGIGLWVAGVPHPGVLTALVFALGIAQIGPLPVMAAAVFWLYWVGSAGWATALLVWSIPVIALDNVLRPILIRRGVELPMLLIIAGVIGGLIGFGVMGLFVGPVVLAATYTLAKTWVAEGDPGSTEAAALRAAADRPSVEAEPPVAPVPDHITAHDVQRR